MGQHQELFQWLGNGFLVWAAVVGTASVLVHMRVPWRQSTFGRHLMYYMVSIAAVLDLGVIKLIIGDSPTFQLIRLVTFIAVPVVMSQRLVLQLRSQRSVRSEQREADR